MRLNSGLLFPLASCIAVLTSIEWLSQPAFSGLDTEFKQQSAAHASQLNKTQTSESKRLNFCAMISKKGQFAGPTKVSGGYIDNGTAIYYIAPNGAVYATYRRDCDRPVGYTNKDTKGFMSQIQYKAEGSSLYLYKKFTVGSTSEIKKEKVASRRP